jgi:hypothetical protein
MNTDQQEKILCNGDKIYKLLSSWLVKLSVYIIEFSNQLAKAKKSNPSLLKK